MREDGHSVDDRGTGQDEARDILRRFIDGGFVGSVEQAGVAVGRTEHELAAMLSGDSMVDDDLIMKIRGIATERDISIE